MATANGAAPAKSEHDKSADTVEAPRRAKKLPDLTNEDPKLPYVRRGYNSREWSSLLFVVVLPLLLGLVLQTIYGLTWEDVEVIFGIVHTHIANLMFFSGLSVAVVLMYFFHRSVPVYLMEFACFLPGGEHQVTMEEFLTKSRNSGHFTPESMDFQVKISNGNGVGPDTHLPPGVRKVPAECSMKLAREEAEIVMFGCIDDLFRKTGLTPKQIDILIVNCSLFNPTPSLSAMIINHYKMRSNIRSYNLSGMGCSAGVISIDLAKDLLQVHPRSRALIISTENITQNWYFGNERSMLIPNTLFRMGGAAILLSNRWEDRFRAKYKLMHTVRTHKGSDDKAYQCVFQREDEKNKIGVHLSKELMNIAGDALKTNITTLGPLVLPLSEQINFFINLVARKVLKIKCKPYIPDFTRAFEHFCIHAGGRAVIDAIQKNMSLDDYLVLPSRQALWRFGNTSSASVWYELLYLETDCRVKSGDRIWQIAFGSGFKCNSAVWKAMRRNVRIRSDWPDGTPCPWEEALKTGRPMP